MKAALRTFLMRLKSLSDELAAELPNLNAQLTETSVMISILEKAVGLIRRLHHAFVFGGQPLLPIDEHDARRILSDLAVHQQHLPHLDALLSIVELEMANRSRPPDDRMCHPAWNCYRVWKRKLSVLHQSHRDLTQSIADAKYKLALAARTQQQIPRPPKVRFTALQHL